MASQYLNWKLRDVKPDPLPPDPTPRQKWRNWWHYHKGMMIAGAVVGLAVLDIAHSALGLGQVRPDYQVAYVGENALPDATAAAIEEAFAALGSDANGDGQVAVQLHQYLISDTMDENAEYSYANQIPLMGDLEDCDSYFFLLEDYETFQADYALLAGADGTLAEAGEPPLLCPLGRLPRPGRAGSGNLHPDHSGPGNPRQQPGPGGVSASGPPGLLGRPHL